MVIHECNQGDRITTLEVNSKNIMEKLDRLEVKTDKLIDTMNSFIVDVKSNYTTKIELEKVTDRAKGRFANKLVEKIVYGMVGTIMSGVLGSVLYFVLK